MSEVRFFCLHYLVYSIKCSTFAFQISRSRAVVACQAHNLKVVGSNPASATKARQRVIWLTYSSFFVYYRALKIFLIDVPLFFCVKKLTLHSCSRNINITFSLINAKIFIYSLYCSVYLVLQRQTNDCSRQYCGQSFR